MQVTISQIRQILPPSPPLPPIHRLQIPLPLRPFRGPPHPAENIAKHFKDSPNLLKSLAALPTSHFIQERGRHFISSPLFPLPLSLFHTNFSPSPIVNLRWYCPFPTIISLLS